MSAGAKDFVGAGGSREAGVRTPVGNTTGLSPTLTDAGNATRFVRQHGTDVRFVPAWGKWLIWDGKRWVSDETGRTVKLAKMTAASIYAEAAAAPEHQRREIVKHAQQSESAKAITAMLKLAEPEVAVTPDLLDADPWFLNVENGTLDLRTGTLRQHQREELLTKLAPVAFDAEASSAFWERFLDRAVPDPEVRAFLARFAGYTLTGDTGEEKLIFVHGREATSKSTFMSAMGAMLGDYAATCDFETFLRKPGAAGVRNDIARLVGVRMAVSLEVDEGRELAEALVKNLTGGDTVSTRFLYREFFEFKPAFKLWLVANDKPKASATDGALWRRILLVPLDVMIPEGERDPAVKAMLTTDPAVRTAILAWAVRGLRDWQIGGLRPPEAVRNATAAYRAEQEDHVAAFVADRCVIQPDAFIASATLRPIYDLWCKEKGKKRLNANALGRSLRDLGCEPGTNPDHGKARGWSGLGPRGAE